MMLSAARSVVTVCLTVLLALLPASSRTPAVAAEPASTPTTAPATAPATRPATRPATTRVAHSPTRWEKDIARFEQRDRENPPQPGGILFIGSSTIGLWKTLEQDFPEHRLIRRGFGGSRVGDAAYYADRIVIPYKPRAVFLRSGGNDLHSGLTPQEVFQHFQEFVNKIHAKLPETKVFFIGLNPTIARWEGREETRELNALVEEYARRTPNVGYVDAYDFTLDEQGNPRPELFLPDKLHLSPEGYKLLVERVRLHLPK